MENLQKTLKSLPQSPGVYLFRARNGTTLYVGKAKNLKKRIQQYYQGTDTRPKIKLLMGEIDQIKVIRTLSEFDAILLEAKVIKDLQPKYNTIAKDDKSLLYVFISTQSELPTVLFVRRPQHLPGQDNNQNYYFGPFQSAKRLRKLMRALRRIIPYCTQKDRNGKPCFYTHLGLCLPCPSVVANLPHGQERKLLVANYRRNILRLRNILLGKTQNVLKEMKKEMKQKATVNDFEQAQIVHEQIQELNLLLHQSFDPSLYLEKTSFLEDTAQAENVELKRILESRWPDLSSFVAIECYDISNISGQWATGSMVTFVNGLPDKNLYRRFKIKTSGKPNDVAMMAEMIQRRIHHKEWLYPQLMIIDGGKPQVQKILTVLKQNRLNIPIIGLAKRYEDIVVPGDPGWKIIRLSQNHPALNLVRRIRDESHRFAVSYHRLLRRKAFIPDV